MSMLNLEAHELTHDAFIYFNNSEQTLVFNLNGKEVLRLDANGGVAVHGRPLDKPNDPTVYDALLEFLKPQR